MRVLRTDGVRALRAAVACERRLIEPEYTSASGNGRRNGYGRTQNRTADPYELNQRLAMTTRPPRLSERVTVDLKALKPAVQLRPNFLHDRLDYRMKAFAALTRRRIRGGTESSAPCPTETPTVTL